MRSLRHTLISVLVAGIPIAACGSDDTADPADTIAPTTSDRPSTLVGGFDVGDATLIGTTSLSGPVVDPQAWPIDTVTILESFPEQIAVTFTAGDPQCTAAKADVWAIDGQAAVLLEVGITEDAASRSCRTGEFEQTVTVPLTEGLDGRTVITPS